MNKNLEILVFILYFQHRENEKNNKGYFAMWYLSEKQSYELADLSYKLINKNGWIDQFVITNKVLAQLHAEVNKLIVGKLNKYALRKELVDTLIVLQHPINHLNITDEEIRNIAFNHYYIDGKEKDPKIARTYRRVLNIPDYKPSQDLNFELDRMSRKVLSYQEKYYSKKDKPGSSYLEKTGIKYQICIAASEPIELTTELSNFIRMYFITGTVDAKEKNMKNNRQNIIDEIYDVLYCLRYIMLVSKISVKELQKFASLRIKDIHELELGR